MFVSYDHGVSAFGCVGEKDRRGGFRCLPRLICQSEQRSGDVEFSALHVGGEDDRLLSSSDELAYDLIDPGLLRVLTDDTHRLGRQ